MGSSQNSNCKGTVLVKAPSGKPLPEMERVWFIRASISLLALIWIFGACLVPLDFLLGRSLFISFFIGLSILALVGSFVWARMFYASYRFELRDRDILVESGVIFRKRTYIPYSRIQNVNVLQGPILRIYGLKSIMIETAGGVSYQQGPAGTGMAEGQIPGPENPESLAEEIMGRVREARAGGGI